MLRSFANNSMLLSDRDVSTVKKSKKGNGLTLKPYRKPVVAVNSNNLNPMKSVYY